MTIAPTDLLPPLASDELLSRLARPTPTYKRRAWLAMAGLVLFVALYTLLAGWFCLTAYRLLVGAAAGGKNAFAGFGVGLCAAFLAIFMLKAVFFIKRGNTQNSIEITAEQQPRLFAFLHALADKAGAPRPHKVFVSPHVNAAVFYDLSVINLIFPSRKNLEIGLGLVNVLTLGELQAVLAHEFGHFAQKAMAVGRWVYISQQIAAHLVARRDKLDDFLRGLSTIDLRISWIGWILSLIVWSIRSLVDTAFSLVILMQRALSREMEMHADLVAVALTGSDALIHALHRLQAADDSWDRAVGFVLGEKARGRITGDAFVVQTLVLERMERLLNDPGYNRVPPVPAEAPETHRLFKAELAQPPQMWLTHPLNHEREANAKREYVTAPIAAGSAWDLFRDSDSLRRQVTAKIIGEAAEGTAVTLEESQQRLDEQFGREYLKGRYRGVYFGRSVVRCEAKPQALYAPGGALAVRALDRLYPESAIQDIELLRTLEKEIGQLRALQAGRLKAPDGVLRHRGRVLRTKELPAAIGEIEKELRAVEGRLQAHDRMCRAAHLAAAEQVGKGWPDYLRGLLAALHYADHGEANLLDALGALRNVIAVETATRRVSSGGVERVITAANSLYRSLDRLFEQREDVMLDASLTTRLGIESWAAALGDFKLSGASKENINDWLNAIDSWVDHTAGSLGALRMHSLEQLLASEAAVAEAVRTGQPLDPAPVASVVPAQYEVLLPGTERERQTRLGWWGRFQTADGILAMAARLVVAAGIVVAVLGFGGTVGRANLTIYNGLGRPLVVSLGDARYNLAAFTATSHDIDTQRIYRVETRTADGQLIESFDAEVTHSLANIVYNVAGASPLVEWTQTYGNGVARRDRELGNARWTTTSADVLFADPPKTISSKTGGGTREVLSGLGDGDPRRMLGIVKTDAERDRVVLLHARWDSTQSRHITDWMWLAARLPEFRTVLASRLKETPEDVMLLRVEQDGSSEADKPAVCARHQSLAKARSDQADMQYIALRCQPPSPERLQALRAAYARWPQNGWLANSLGYEESLAGHWAGAQDAWEKAFRRLPGVAASLAVDIARVRRMQDKANAHDLAEFAQVSDQLQWLLALENGSREEPHAKAYAALAAGKLDQALQMARTRPESEPRLLRLVAASDGAKSAWIERALALTPDQGLDESTIWTSIAVAIAANKDASIYFQKLGEGHTDEVRRVRNFAEALKSGMKPETAELMLGNLPPQLRGQAYCMGAIIIGVQAPRHWRQHARKLLFASERPYFL